MHDTASGIPSGGCVGVFGIAIRYGNTSDRRGDAGKGGMEKLKNASAGISMPP